MIIYSYYLIEFEASRNLHWYPLIPSVFSRMDHVVFVFYSSTALRYPRFLKSPLSYVFIDFHIFPHFDYFLYHHFHINWVLFDFWLSHFIWFYTFFKGILICFFHAVRALDLLVLNKFYQFFSIDSFVVIWDEFDSRNLFSTFTWNIISSVVIFVFIQKFPIMFFDWWMNIVLFIFVFLASIVIFWTVLIFDWSHSFLDLFFSLQKASQLEMNIILNVPFYFSSDYKG